MVALPPWSYTALDTFDNCPRQYEWKFIKKNKEPPSKEMIEGRAVHEALEKRVCANVALPDAYVMYEPLVKSLLCAGDVLGNEIRTELKLAITREMKPAEYFGKDVWGRSGLDISIFCPGVNPEFVFIADYKTGKPREKDFQMKVMSIFTFLHYPTVERIDAANIWLQQRKVGKHYRFYKEDFPRMWSEVFIKLSAMENAATVDKFIPRPSPLCGWCPVLTCEHNPKK